MENFYYQSLCYDKRKDCNIIVKELNHKGLTCGKIVNFDKSLKYSDVVCGRSVEVSYIEVEKVDDDGTSHYYVVMNDGYSRFNLYTLPFELICMIKDAVIENKYTIHKDDEIILDK